MKMLYCWRCKMEVPMLDETEFKKAAELYSSAFSNKGSMTERMKPLIDYYKEVSGWEETVYNAIMHHRIAQYGPPCEENCGKPYIEHLKHHSVQLAETNE